MAIAPRHRRFTKQVFLRLEYVDELIAVRQAQHGGGQGAPPLLADGVRVGASVNRSIVVMISALLQSYVEDVFHRSAKRVFPSFQNDAEAYGRYWRQMKNWGNPSDENITHLFLKIGVTDILDGLSWRGFSNQSVRTKLKTLNLVRNQIAHGKQHLQLNQQPYSLSLQEAKTFRNFTHNFGERFEAHAVEQARRSRILGG